jgi:hypothetical protein
MHNMSRHSILFSFFFAFLHIDGNAASDTVIQYRFLQGSLSSTSDRFTNGAYYTYLPINMIKGDMAYFVYKSKDYATAFYVRDSAGTMAGMEDNSGFSKTKGSKIAVPYLAKETGAYYFMFSSKEPGAKGKFSIDLYYYNKETDKVTNASPFCDRLRYLLMHDPMKFELLKGAKTSSYVMNIYRPTIALDPSATNEIAESIVEQFYRTNWTPNVSMAKVEGQYNQLVTSIAKCLPAAKRKVYTGVMVSEHDKESFVARTDFSESGKTPGDAYILHRSENIRYKIVVRIEKGVGNVYQLKLELR